MHEGKLAFEKVLPYRICQLFFFLERIGF